MESRDPGKQKTGRAQKLTEDTCGGAYQRSLACKCSILELSGLCLVEFVQRADFAYLFAGLDKNGYDKSKCEDVFDLYIKCKRREVRSFRADQRSTDSAKRLETAYLP